MRSVRIRAHGELADHLPSRSRGIWFVVCFELPRGTRDLIQSQGIPHVEVGAVAIDGAEAGWGVAVGGGESIELWARYPLDRPEPDPRFLLDVHLRKLARHLRLAGFDAVHTGDADDPELADDSVRSGAILLTRDRRLLMRSRLGRGRWIRSTDPVEQGSEVLRSFALSGRAQPFTRCLECNVVLEQASPTEDEVPPGVWRLHDRYSRCPDCGRVYWAGTHHRRLQSIVARMIAGGR